MKRRLFLTGAIGCGKSTAIFSALGDRLGNCGGFLTRRHRGETLTFTLESPDGALREPFLEFPEGKPELHADVFSRLGKQLLEGDVLVLDEIGGVELLNPDFMAALERALERDIPILGVIKGEGPAGALIETLGLTEEYTRAANRLRERLLRDENTLVYTCGQFDENARRLAEAWVEEYIHE